MEHPELKISNAQCWKILQRYLGSREFTINSFSTKPLSSQYEGLIGEQHIIGIVYIFQAKEECGQFFLKMLDGGNQVMFEVSKSINAFEKEAFFYETLVPLFESEGIEMNFVPKSFLCEKYSVVLEDLSLSGYKGTTKNIPLDLEHCKKCLETMAKFHAVPIIFEQMQTKNPGKNKKGNRLNNLFGDMLEGTVFSGQDNGATRFLNCSIKGLLQLIELIPEIGAKKEALIAALKAAMHEIMSKNHPSELRNTILHGDLWSNNFLFKYDQSRRLLDAKLIDFQVIKWGPPALDVLQFIFTNTRKAFRETHRAQLLQHYYQNFSNCLKHSDLDVEDILGQDEFETSCSLLEIPAKIQSIIDRSITFMSDKTLSDAAESRESFEKFLFEERANFMVDAFHGNNYFREVMSEDIAELGALLFSGD